MAYNYGNTVGFPEADTDTPPVDVGRLAGLFCQLNRREFTGLAQVETADKYAVYVFRAGSPVYVEESSAGASVGDSLLKRGLLTRDQYADVVGHMTESLVESEDLVFCEQVVRLGYLSAEQVRAEMSERVRAKIIQAMSMTGCRVEFDESEEALSGMGDYAQDVGPLVYMGVRAFYDEELLASFVPDPRRHYMRLVRPLSKIAAFFALDEDETKFLRSLDPESTLQAMITSSIVDEAHAIQVIALLHLASMVRFGTSPFVAVPEPERSGLRSTAQVLQSPRARAPSRPRMPAVSPNSAASRVSPADDEPEAARPATSAREVAKRPASPSPFVAAREVSGTASRTGRYPKAQDEARVDEPGTAPPSGRRAPSTPPRRVSAAEPEAADAAARPAVKQASSDAGRDLAAEALAEAKARARKEPRRPVGTAVAQRLGEQLKRMRGPAAPAASPPSAAPAAVSPAAASPAASEGSEYAKVHLKELLSRRRQLAQGATSQPIASKRDPAQDFRQGQDLLRDLHFARAEELLRGVVERVPDNDLYKTYHLWAKFRASSTLDKPQLDSLKELAKKLTQDEGQAAFAFYALGHINLFEKKDDVAEKFFRKAQGLDKNNKDAERHVLILERRKQLASDPSAQGERKIFGITISSASKDKA